MKKKYSDDPIENIGFRSKNPAEIQLHDLMVGDGFEVVKRGWPDFACLKGDELFLVEVKPNGFTRLKRSQYRLMKALAGKGIKCYRWSPDIGFQLIS